MFLTDQADPDLAALELRHRQRARVEDRIRAAKATGLANLPFDRWRRNAVWLELVLAAQDLTCWTQALLLDGALAVAEPKTLRYRLLHVAARIVRHARRLILRLQASLDNAAAPVILPVPGLRRGFWRRRSRRCGYGKRCGVCGIVGAYDVGAVDDRCLAAMSEAIAHRGPDAVGAWSGPGDPPRVRLGHRRLSIIDLSDAAQLFVKDGLVPGVLRRDRQLPRLKAELGAAGTGFRTDSDTEVLLEAWRRWAGQPPPSARHVRLRPERRAPGHAHPGS